jgi:hypothetical protein
MGHAWRRSQQGLACRGSEKESAQIARTQEPGFGSWWRVVSGCVWLTSCVVQSSPLAQSWAQQRDRASNHRAVSSLWPPKRSHAAIHGRRLGHRRSDTRGAPAHWPKVSPCRAKRGRERSVLKDSFSGQAGRWACKGGTTTQTPSCGGHTTATHHFIQTAIRKSPCRAASTGLQRRQTSLAPRCQTPAEEQNLPSLFHVATWTNRLLLRGVIRNNAARLQSFLASHRAAATKDARAAFVQSSIVPLLAAGDHTQYSVHTKV